VLSFLLSILRAFDFARLIKHFSRTEVLGNTSSGRLIPKKVRIDGKWYNVSESLDGTLDLAEFMNPVKYRAKEPYIHIFNFYFVYDTNGNKVGEFDIGNRSYSGSVSDFEM